MTEVKSTLLPESLRDDFPILHQKIRNDKQLAYLDNASTTQRPRSVIQSMVDMYEKDYANVHRGIHWLSDQSTDHYEGAREKVRVFIGAEHIEEVVFTTGTTAGINLVARSWGDANIKSDDEIIVTELEHHANLVPWHQLSERTGCTIRALPITDDGQLQIDALPDLLNERTRILAVSAASNVLGTITPITELTKMAHANGTLVVVDAAQYAPHAAMNVSDWDADFVVFSGHKLMGPSGVGVLYGKREHLTNMPPFLGGGSMIRRVKIDSFEPADSPARFEAGTPPIVPVVGLGAAIDYLTEVGVERVAAHERTLATKAHELIQNIEGLKILGPPIDSKAGIVSFHIDGVHAHDVAQLLDREGVAVRAGHHCAMPLHKRLNVNATSRASFYLYNTLDEVDQFANGLKKAVALFRNRRRK